MKYKISERHIRSYTTTSLSEAGGKKKKLRKVSNKLGVILVEEVTRTPGNLKSSLSVMKDRSP